MAITSGFFNSINGDRKYTAEQIGNYFEGIISNGILRGIGNEFTVQAGDGMNIKIGTGRAIINCHWIKNSTIVTLPISAANPQYNRIDAVKLRLDLNEASRKIEIIVDTGIPNSAAKTPTRSGNVYELIIAYVNVTAGATNITQNNITDCRSGKYCGWVNILNYDPMTHPTVEVINSTVSSTPTEINAGDIFAAVTNITRDYNGHVKTFDVNVYQLPSNDVKVVFTGASNGTRDGTKLPNGHVYFNLVLNGKIVSGHKISGANGAEVTTDENGDVVVTAKSSCANTGTLTHDEQNMTIDTGLTETPKIFILYCNYNGNIVQAAKCRPGLATPFECVLNADLPIASIDFNGGTATVNCHTSTGLTFAWEAYI